MQIAESQPEIVLIECFNQFPLPGLKKKAVYFQAGLGLRKFQISSLIFSHKCMLFFSVYYFLFTLNIATYVTFKLYIFLLSLDIQDVVLAICICKRMH